jgi:hypothetical protein
MTTLSTAPSIEKLSIIRQIARVSTTFLNCYVECSCVFILPNVGMLTVAMPKFTLSSKTAQHVCTKAPRHSV